MPRARFLLAALFTVATVAATAASLPDGKELVGRMVDLARPDRAEVHEIGRSVGEQKLRVLEIAPEIERDGAPAILVVANAEGDLPLTSLAAVELAAEILAAPENTPAGSVRWYILPMASPDGLEGIQAFVDKRKPDFE